MRHEPRAALRSLVRRLVGGLLADLGPRPADDTSVSAQMRRNAARALLWGATAWQVLMLIVIWLEPDHSGSHYALAAGHLLALLIALPRRPGPATPVLVYIVATSLFFADWLVVTDVGAPLLLATCWMMNLASAATTFTIRGRAGLVVPLVGAAALPVPMVLARPELVTLLPISVVITQWTITGATRIAFAAILDFADRADTEIRTSIAQVQADAAQRSAARTAAEDSRVLHDTLVNTLAAIASGGAATRDSAAVHQRCRSDLDRIQSLDDADARTRPTGLGELAEIGHRLGIDVVQSGSAPAELMGAERRLGTESTEALLMAATEALLNVSKHSGATSGTLDLVAGDDAFVVRVHDTGRGFDGAIPMGRGLDRSIHQRAAAHGIAVQLETRPGAGTTVTLTAPYDAVADADADKDADEGEARRLAGDFVAVTHGLQVRVAFAWMIGAGLEGLLLATVNHPGTLNAEHAMAVIATAACIPTMLRLRRGAEVGRAHVFTLLAGAVASFLCSAAAVDFGRAGDMTLWQAIGCTSPLVLLTVIRPASRDRTVAMAVLATGPVAAALYVVIDSRSVAAVAPLIAGTAALGLVGGWGWFNSALGKIGAQTAAEQTASARARLDTVRRSAVTRARERLRTKVVDQSTSLLAAVVEGAADPTHADFRRSCAAAEQDLRQLILLDPDLLVMGTWLARALGEARGRGVGLVIRTGDVDAAEADARHAGQLIVDLVASAPSGSQLTLTHFPAGDGTRLTLVAPHGAAAEARGHPSSAALALAALELGEHDVLEIDLPAVATGAAA